MITTPSPPSQHAVLIASALADVTRSGAKQHPGRGPWSALRNCSDAVLIAFADAQPDTVSGPADAALALQDAEVLATRYPGAGLPPGFTAAVLASVSGHAPELPVPVGAAPHTQLAAEDAWLRARLALVEEWLLDTQHPHMTSAYASMSLTLRTKLAHTTEAVAVDSRAWLSGDLRSSPAAGR